MGVELHRIFPFVDYVCSGESDESFPRLVRAIRDGGDPSEIGGLSFRRNNTSVRSTVPQQPIADMDSLPIPDHSDFLDAFRGSTASLFIRPQLTMETSRGCWWGQKHHCVFCGLNGLSMRYRSKSVRRAFEEVKELVRTYGIHSFFNTDNILDLGYFSKLFPMLEADGVKVELYYETKSNLRKDQLIALKRIGTNWIQPGIESLSTHVLRLMDKGVSAIQNVQLLKWARELRMAVTWNVIWGFPGECAGLRRNGAPDTADLAPAAAGLFLRTSERTGSVQSSTRHGVAALRCGHTHHMPSAIRLKGILTRLLIFLVRTRHAMLIS